jgi:hypothetical protein
MDHCTFGDATVSKLTSNYLQKLQWNVEESIAFLKSGDLQFPCKFLPSLPRLYSVGTAGLRQPQSNWAIRLFTNNSLPKYSCHCSIFINFSMPLMRGNLSLRYKASMQLLAHSANHCLWTTVCNQEVSVNNFTYLSRLCAFNNQQKKKWVPKSKQKSGYPPAFL